MQQHQGRAVRTPECVHGQWVSHGQKYRRVPPRLMSMPEEHVAGIEFVPEGDGRGGVTVMMDGSPQSHVNLADPGSLGFEYIAHFAAVIDTLPAGPLGVTHIGGAGLTLARYVNAERPGSPQIVLEPNIELTELVRRELPLPRQHRIRVRPVDGHTGAVASHSPLDLAALRRQVAKMPFPTGLREGDQLARQFAGSAVFTTTDSAQSPPPPPVKGWRVR